MSFADPKSTQQPTDELQSSLQCSDADWARVKSSGRQGVRRAFLQGGIRKAKLKLEKMIQAADRMTANDMQDDMNHKRAKKRKKRCNARHREQANQSGHLTLSQLYILFANERSNWYRLNEWLQPLNAKKLGGRQASELRDEKKRNWIKEYEKFQTEFATELAKLPTGNNMVHSSSCALSCIDWDSTMPLFISTVTPVLVSPPDEIEAQRLWNILKDQGHRPGTSIGGTTVPLSTTDNLGAKMLLALGWNPGTGLGRKRQGICEPILMACGSTKQQRLQQGIGFVPKKKAEK